MHALAEPGAGAVLFFVSETGPELLTHPGVSKIVVIKMKNNDFFVKVGWQICGYMSPFFLEKVYAFFA